jgi:hypothetical protein
MNNVAQQLDSKTASQKQTSEQSEKSNPLQPSQLVHAPAQFSLFHLRSEKSSKLCPKAILWDPTHTPKAVLRPLHKNAQTTYRIGNAFQTPNRLQN